MKLNKDELQEVLEEFLKNTHHIFKISLAQILVASDYQSIFI